jgi:prepilin-type N-terminal cleavage/methylation domain-containing protein
MTLRLRAGFTLIESAVAIILFSVGALAFAGTTAVLMRALTESGVKERAARVASTRLEMLRALPCGTRRTGAELLPGIQSSWTVVSSAALTSAVATVTYSLHGAPRTETYSAVLPCPP